MGHSFPVSPESPWICGGLFGWRGCAVLPWRLCAVAPLRMLGRCPAPRRSPAPLCRSRAWCGRCSGGGRAWRLRAAAAFMLPCARVHPGRALLGKWAGMKLSSQRQGTRECVTCPEAPGRRAARSLPPDSQPIQVAASAQPLAKSLLVGSCQEKQKDHFYKIFPFSAPKTPRIKRKARAGGAWTLSSDPRSSTPPPPLQTQAKTTQNFRDVALSSPSKSLPEFQPQGRWGRGAEGRGN